MAGAELPAPRFEPRFEAGPGDRCWTRTPEKDEADIVAALDIDPLSLTPGPLTTSAATKQAMLRDWSARHGDFIELTTRVRHGLLRIVDGESDHVAVRNRALGRASLAAGFSGRHLIDWRRRPPIAAWSAWHQGTAATHCGEAL